MDFYDRQGNARMYIGDNCVIYLWNGKPVGFARGDAIHNYSGATVARLQNGWVRDLQGNAVLFTDNASGGPLPPIKKIPAIKSIPQIPRIPPIPGIPPIPKMPTLNWSGYDWDDILS